MRALLSKVAHRNCKWKKADTCFTEVLTIPEKTSYAYMEQPEAEKTRICRHGLVPSEGIITVHWYKGRLCRELSVELILFC